MRHALFLLALTWACAAGSARPVREAGAAPAPAQAPAPAKQASDEAGSVDRPQYPSTYQRHTGRPVLIRNATIMTAAGQEIRSEEHTSELQSLCVISYAVFCLKKK